MENSSIQQYGCSTKSNLVEGFNCVLKTAGFGERLMPVHKAARIAPI